MLPIGAADATVAPFMNQIAVLPLVLRQGWSELVSVMEAYYSRAKEAGWDFGTT
jgi:hypothetical protein